MAETNTEITLHKSINEIHRKITISNADPVLAIWQKEKYILSTGGEKMPIKKKQSGALVDIKEVIVRMGGVLVRTCPLQGKINGVLVDFISYGYDVTALINMTPTGFTASTLSLQLIVFLPL